MYRILTNDGLQQSAISKLEALGIEVVNTHYNQDILGEKLKDFDAIVIRSATKLTKDVLDEASKGKLKLAIRAGVGIDNIDVKCAEDLGITVRNTPNASSDSVAELAIGHMFSIARFLGESNSTMRNGEWNKKKYQGTEIYGKTLGIIGMGRIGKSLAKKAEALGMKVIYYTIEGKHDELHYEFFNFEDVLKSSDFLSIHVPYNKDTESLIGENEFNIMKYGIYIVNCSRGKVVDEDALLKALESGKVSGAGIDVFEKEPTQNKALVNHPRVSVSPHIGASTREAQDRIGEEIFSVVKEFFNL
ncbi:D-2-hydroxyacid dehydrogenase [Clostridium sardiniense]|uniref:D-2-hydroxyacid dehydrogenase n=1 Tax=Clostridium sardiniense TaxID=29369 RepID=A0ABS7L239_CLOSR|nr:D-2-hydroxyacid dehydrogenase [Clostridium sardiniense]MBY0757145.1 D-2-hydroxyacid dehydrogenase [Clostridium sardiniense]MDQ0461397.1 D-3-phosphoglycerate dehydrogenase [Clostridium sardiniense]